MKSGLAGPGEGVQVQGPLDREAREIVFSRLPFVEQLFARRASRRH